MSDSPRIEAILYRFWVIPPDATDFEPLPALVTEVGGLPDGAVFLFDRKKREFNTSNPHDSRHTTLYPTFEECRHAMTAQWLDDLRDATLSARHAASVIEHLRTIPTQPFPDVLPEVSEPQASQEKEAQEKEATEPKVMAEPTKRPAVKGKSNG